MEGLVLGQYFNGNISIFYKYADLSDRGTFLFPETLFYKIMAFSSDKMKQALIAQSMSFLT